jgi:hypothetical protein
MIIERHISLTGIGKQPKKKNLAPRCAQHSLGQHRAQPWLRNYYLQTHFRNNRHHFRSVKWARIFYRLTRIRDIAKKTQRHSKEIELKGGFSHPKT